MAIITIGGNLGAGKTTLAKNLSQALGYEELYMGGIFREMAKERGISIEAFYAELKSDPSLERSVDERQAKLMKEKDNLVVQGRITWFFARESPFKIFNIFLTVDPAIGTLRTAKREENAGRPVRELAAANAERRAAELERYRLLYGIENFLDPSHYDFVLDTSNLTEEEVLGKVIEKFKSR